MNSDPLDQLLGMLAKEPLPPSPPNLEANVLRTVRLEAADRRPFAWPEWLSLPRFGTATAAVALLLGLLVGSGAREARIDFAQAATRQVLALDVFGPDAAGLPHRLLEHP